MERWSGLSTRQKVAVTMGVTAGAALLYVCYTRYRAAPEHGEDELRVTVPQRVAELIIGPDGAISGQLTQSCAHIEVSAAPGGHCELTIKGSPAQVRQTQQLLHRILQGGAALRVELCFPARSMGRIIGQGGERIREITKSSGARIDCERRADCNASAPTRSITVTGTLEQVEAAKTLLRKASEEEAAVQRRAAESSTFRSRRKEIIAVKKKDIERPQEDKERQTPPMSAPHCMDPAKGRPSMDSPTPQENMADCTYNVCKFEVPSPDFSFRADEYVDVYVSAVENPEHFWIQIVGSRSSQLDKLTTEMSDHYQRQKRDTVPEILVGDIVASPFHSDNFWYRAEVLGFLKNGNVDLLYVDYGDNWDTAKENLYPLRSDFLSLPFQAIECRLSGVAPRGGVWSDQALDAFDALSHCAEWKPLLAKISSFPTAGVSRFFQIQLYDPATDPMLDIGLELIRQGHAIECRVSPMKPDDDESLVSRLLEEVTNLSVRSEAGSLSSWQEKESLASDTYVPDESIEIIRADPSPDHQQSILSSPPSCLECVEEADILEQSMSKIQINDSDHPLSCLECVEEADGLGQSVSKIQTSESDHPATTSPSTDPSSQNTSSSNESSESFLEGSCSSSTCTASEGQSNVSSALEDSSIYSPRGCFYYLTDETSSSSIFTCSSGEVITISSDSEEDPEKVQTAARKAPTDSGKMHLVVET